MVRFEGKPMTDTEKKILMDMLAGDPQEWVINRGTMTYGVKHDGMVLSTVTVDSLGQYKNQTLMPCTFAGLIHALRSRLNGVKTN